MNHEWPHGEGLKWGMGEGMESLIFVALSRSLFVPEANLGRGPDRVRGAPRDWGAGRRARDCPPYRGMGREIG